MHKAVSCMFEPKRPTPVLSVFEVTQRLRGRLEPKGVGETDVRTHAKLGGKCNVLP